MYKLPIILLLLFCSCYELSPSRIEEETAKLLENRRQTYLNERMLECTRSLYSKAQTIADSILKIESRNSKLDSITVPHDTAKPTKPELMFPAYHKPERD